MKIKENYGVDDGFLYMLKGQKELSGMEIVGVTVNSVLLTDEDSGIF